MAERAHTTPTPASAHLASLDQPRRTGADLAAALAPWIARADAIRGLRALGATR